MQELEENVRVGQSGKSLTQEEVAGFMNWVGNVGQGFCRNCGYCLPCPEDIPIPDIFRFEGYFDRYGLEAWARDQYRALSINAESCILCNECLTRCPYGVAIPQRLKEVHQRLGM